MDSWKWAQNEQMDRGMSLEQATDYLSEYLFCRYLITDEKGTLNTVKLVFTVQQGRQEGGQEGRLAPGSSRSF